MEGPSRYGPPTTVSCAPRRMAFGSKLVTSSFFLSCSWVRSGLCACDLRWAIIVAVKRKVTSRSLSQGFSEFWGRARGCIGLGGVLQVVAGTNASQYTIAAGRTTHNQHDSFFQLLPEHFLVRQLHTIYHSEWHNSLVEAASSHRSQELWGTASASIRRGIQPPENVPSACLRSART